MVTASHKAFFNRIFEPLAKLLLFFRITPNQVTCAGTVFGLLSCLIFLKTRNTILFFILIVFFGFFDVLDGALARVSGRVSKFGSYLDAMCDRLFEGAVALTVAWVSGKWELIVLALIGANMISYAKARAAMEVPISNTEWPDLMERAERSLIFILGFLISDVTQLKIAGHDLFFWTLVFLNFAIYFTVIQRLFRAKRLIDLRS